MRMRKLNLHFKVATLCLGVILVAPAVQAEIEYDPGKNILKVYNYPDCLPCTLQILFKASQRNNWNVVEYHKDTNTYIISADLHIGKTGSVDTYFQIGNKKYPSTKLIVRGDVFVFPTTLPQATKAKNINRLILGDEKNPKVKTILAIGQFKNKRKGVYISCIPHDIKYHRHKTGAGGELQVFNSEVTSEDANKAGAIREIVMAGANTQLVNSKISWVKGQMTCGLRGYLMDKTKIENTVFENGGMVFRDFSTSRDRRFKKVIKNCRFQNCGTAINATSVIKIYLENCKFIDNLLNWKLIAAGFINLTDCDFGNLQKNNYYALKEYCAKRNLSIKLTSERHVIIKVTDSSGRPITGATITITTDNSKQPSVAKTGDNGETPGKDSELAVLLPQVILETTAIKNQPKIIEFMYTITVNAPGYKNTIIKDFAPKKSWEIVTAVMQKI